MSEVFTNATRDAEDLSKVVNQTSGAVTNRTGATIRPLPVVIADIEAQGQAAIANTGWFAAAGSFEDGGTITERNQYLQLVTTVGGDVAGGYSWGGALPKVVPAGSTPATTGGIDADAWVYRGDATVTAALADGSADIAGVQAADVAQVSKSWAPVFVESFRQVGFSDSETIQAALSFINDLTTSGHRLIFDAGRIYTYNAEHSLKNINDLLIDLNGATLRRADGSTTSTTLASALTVAGGTTLQLSSVPANWKVGEFIAAFTSDSDVDTSRDRAKITNISGNTVTISSPFTFSPTKETLPIGTVVAKAFSVFTGRPSATDSTALPLTPGNNRRIFITNGTIDGNRDNQLNVSWRFIVEIGISSNGGVIEKVNFKNITGETFVGHGVTIQNCVFEDIGGSCYHTSVNDQTSDLAGFAFFRGNTCKRIGIATNAKVGHAEGAITFSWNPGNLIVTGNVMEDLTEYFLGNFAPSTGANSGEFMTVYGNIIKGAKGVFDFIQSPALGINIFGNVFHDCGNNLQKTQTLNENITCSFRGNVLSGTTTAIQQSRSDSQLVGALRNGATQVGDTVSYIARSIIPAYTPPLGAEITTAVESNSSNFHAYVSPVSSGTAHYHPGGNAAGSAFSFFDVATLTYTVGTNETGGITTLKAGEFQAKLRATPDGIDTPNFNGLYLGDKDTDGSWRFAFSGSDLVIQRREGGAWVTKDTILA